MSLGVIRAIGRRTSPPSLAAGNSATRIFGTGAASGNSSHREGLVIVNHDVARTLWVKLVGAGATLPSIAANSHDYAIPPRQSLELRIASSIDACIQNDTGSATTTEYSAWEVM